MCITWCIVSVMLGSIMNVLVSFQALVYIAALYCIVAMHQRRADRAPHRI